MMQAIVITAPGDADVLQLQQRPIPQPGDEEVLIRVKAAGINRPDIAQRKGHYPAPAGAPQDIPGLEVAGIVEACGRQVHQWKPGDQVCALLAGGGYAEYAVAHAGHCLPVLPSLSFTGAASLPETVFTVYHNVFERGGLQANENILIHGGSSGIGITAIQLATAIGANAYATAGNAQKCFTCKELGAVDCINYKEEDFEEALKDAGMDVILDMIGGAYFQKNINMLNADGRLVYINAMKGAAVQMNIIEIMRKRLTITGSTLRNREVAFKSRLAEKVLQQVWPMIEEGKYKPVVYKIFPMAEAAEAHRLLESSEHIGKIVLEMDS